MTSEAPHRTEAGAAGGGDIGDGGVAGTGDDRVDAAVSRLDELDDLPVADHVGRYDEVHAALQDTLTAVELD